MTINMDELRVGSKLLSIKTQQVFEVVALNHGSKVDIENEQGDAKSLSQSTLKRWYKLIVEAAAEPETTEPEVQPEPEVEPQEVSTVNLAYIEALEGEPEPELEDEGEPEVEEVVDRLEDAVERIEEVANELEEVVPPVQPAIPEATTRRAPNAQPSDPVIVALRQRILDEVISVCLNAVQRETNSYTGLKVGKYNFAEIYKGKRRFSIRVIGKALTEEQAALCSLAPASYGWTLDATFTVLVEDDFQMAVDILKASYAYRFNNTPQRGKKSN